jgi:hypothetical protein
MSIMNQETFPAAEQAQQATGQHSFKERAARMAVSLIATLGVGGVGEITVASTASATASGDQIVHASDVQIQDLSSCTADASGALTVPSVEGIASGLTPEDNFDLVVGLITNDNPQTNIYDGNKSVNAQGQADEEVPVDTPGTAIVQNYDNNSEIATNTITVNACSAATPPPVSYSPNTSSYWMASADGGIFSYGSAPFEGSIGGHVLNQPIVGMAEDPATGGYWEVAADGGIFSFNAPFYGSTGNLKLNEPIVAMIPTSNGSGYQLAAEDGGLFAFGAASFDGNPISENDPQTDVVSAAPLSGATGGYVMAGKNGDSFAFTSNGPEAPTAVNGSLVAPMVGAAGYTPTA